MICNIMMHVMLLTFDPIIKKLKKTVASSPAKPLPAFYVSTCNIKIWEWPGDEATKMVGEYAGGSEKPVILLP